MILQLVRRDAVWKAIPFAMIAALLRGLVFRGDTNGLPAVLSSTVVVMAVLLLVVNQLSSAAFLSHLPVSVGDIYCARVFSLALLLSSTLITAAPWIHGIAPIEFMAAIWLLSLIAQSVMVNRQSGFRPWMFGLSFVVGTFLPMIHLWAPGWLTGRRGLAVTLACLIGSGCIFLWRWRTLPASFQVAPVGVQANVRPSSRGSWRWPLMIYHWRYALMCGVIWTQTAGGGFSGSVMGIFAVMGIVQTRQWIFTLPVSRRLLLAMWLMPVLVMGIAGSATRILSPWGWPPTEIRVMGNPRTLTAPLEIWQLANSGNVPVVLAPWGEQSDPSVVEVNGRVAYNPYTVRPGSSERLLEWQEARARSAIRSRGVRWRVLESESILLFTAIFMGTAAVLCTSWRRMRRTPAWLRWTPAGVIFIGWMLMLWRPITDPRWNPRDLLVRLSWILPHTWAAVAVIPAVVFLVVADKWFREGEFIDQTRPAKQL